MNRNTKRRGSIWNLAALILALAAVLGACSGDSESTSSDRQAGAVDNPSESSVSPRIGAAPASEPSDGGPLGLEFTGPEYRTDEAALAAFAEAYEDGDLKGIARVWYRLTATQRLAALDEGNRISDEASMDDYERLIPAQDYINEIDYGQVWTAAERERRANDPSFGRLRGRVLERGTDTPLAGVTLHYHNDQVTTGADGSFELAGIHPGKRVLNVASETHQALFHNFEAVASQVTETTIYLEPVAPVIAKERGTLRGVFVDKDTQEPIEGLEVLVSFGENAADIFLGQGDWGAVTDENGAFEIDDIAEGPVVVAAQKPPAYVAPGLRVTMIGNQVVEERFELQRLGGRLEIPVMVAGVVSDALTGEPVAGVRVSVGSFRSATTDRDGRYLIKKASQGELTLAARHVDYHDHEESLMAEEPGMIERSFTIRPITTGAIAGIAVDKTTGEPLPDAVIAIAGRTLRTDSQGRFRIDEIESGEIDVQATADRYRVARGRVQLVARSTAETRLELDPITEGAVLGIVVDASTGRPLPGVAIGIGTLATESGPDGSFRLADVPAGLATVVGRKAVYEPASSTLDVVAAEQVSVRLSLEPITYGDLTVIVRDAATGDPIVGSSVKVPGTDGATTDDRGRAVFERVPAGRLTIAARRHAYLDGNGSVELEPAAAVEHVLRLDPVTVGVVAGVVVSAADGAPISGAEVVIGDQSVTAGRDGAFRFEEVDAGAATVTARKAVFEPGSRAIDVVAAEAVDVRVALEPITYGAIAGVVIDAASGRPIADAAVTIGARKTGTDNAGRFSLEQVPAGRLQLSATRPVYEPGRESLELEPAETLELRIALEPITYGELTGQVVDAQSRAPLAGARVRVAGRSLTADGSGRFALERVEAGRLTVSGEMAAYHPGQTTVALDPAGTADALVALEPIMVGTVVGVVRDAKTGEPIPGARVEVGGRSLETDSQGRFRFPETEAGAVAVNARHADYGDGAASGRLTGDGTLELDVRMDLRREDVTQLEAGLANDGKIDLYGIHFDSGRDQFKPSSLGTLNAVLKVIERAPGRSFRIAGHTDWDGSDAYNQDLSERRARTVIEWLVEHGVDRGRLRGIGYGEARPAAPNDTESGKALNRRVELSYAG